MKTPFELNLVACARCRRWDRPRPGLIVCIEDGRDIRDNARSGTCPLGHFKTGVPTCDRCGSPAHVVTDCPVPPGYVATPTNATAGGCGCDGSQTQDVLRPK